MVRIVNSSESCLTSKSFKKNMYCFGAGKIFFNFIRENPNIHIRKVIDNFKSGSINEIDGKLFPIISLEQFAKECDKNTSVIITCQKYEEVITQMDSMPELDEMECYLYIFLKEYTEHYSQYPISKRKAFRIPKKIHYCWFGKSDLPSEYLENIKTWSKHCPDYELIRWDESNYNVEKNEYLRKTYKNGKWAFVSDYARVDVIYQYGGVYLDTDVELLRNFDEFLKWDMFCGFESNSYINWGLGFGAVCGHEILKEVLDVYGQMNIEKDDGTLNLINCPVIQSSVMGKHGFELNGTPQEKNNIAVYPKDFFSPYSYRKGFGKITKNTHSIHHYSASWQEGSVKKDWNSLINFVKQHQR